MRGSVPGNWNKSMGLYFKSLGKIPCASHAASERGLPICASGSNSGKSSRLELHFHDGVQVFFVGLIEPLNDLGLNVCCNMAGA
mmetsp:Transcript_66752/g.118104  ORF Transcript_66752/g.118104 Transcript_66752/m.118104 type:complete len:84 (+) Transcript_66752:1519-1770(+)